MRITWITWLFGDLAKTVFIHPLVAIIVKVIAELALIWIACGRPRLGGCVGGRTTRVCAAVATAGYPRAASAINEIGYRRATTG